MAIAGLKGAVCGGLGIATLAGAGNGETGATGFGVTNPPGEIGETGETPSEEFTDVAGNGATGETGEIAEMEYVGTSEPVPPVIVCVVPVTGDGPEPLFGATNKSCCPELLELDLWRNA